MFKNKEEILKIIKSKNESYMKERPKIQEGDMFSQEELTCFSGNGNHQKGIRFATSKFPKYDNYAVITIDLNEEKKYKNEYDPTREELYYCFEKNSLKLPTNQKIINTKKAYLFVVVYKNNKKFYLYSGLKKYIKVFPGIAKFVFLLENKYANQGFLSNIKKENKKSSFKFNEFSMKKINKNEYTGQESSDKKRGSNLALLDNMHQHILNLMYKYYLKNYKNNELKENGGIDFLIETKDEINIFEVKTTKPCNELKQLRGAVSQLEYYAFKYFKKTDKKINLNIVVSDPTTPINKTLENFINEKNIKIIDAVDKYNFKEEEFVDFYNKK